MAARKAPAKTPKKPAKKAVKRTVKKAVKKAVAAVKRVAKKAAAAKRAPAKRRPPGAPPIERTRVVIPMDVYEPQKDAIKAPLKGAELKWNFLGEGKGLYKRADGGVHCFTQFLDDGVHYSLWGDDKPAVNGILSAWRSLLGEEAYAKATTRGDQAAAQEQQQKESEALRLWRLGEPQRRPGEPDLFFQKRLAEWQARRPA